MINNSVVPCKHQSLSRNFQEEIRMDAMENETDKGATQYRCHSSNVAWFTKKLVCEFCHLLILFHFDFLHLGCCTVKRHLMRISNCFISIFFILGTISCNKKTTLFQFISSDHSHIHFNNKIVENDSINPFDVTNIYNGGGVGIGDFNNDGLQDVYFTGGQVSSKLYLNKGDFKFEDVTNAAKVDGNGKWCRGVAVVDINNDGWQDIYVCSTISSDSIRRQNLLYINKGLSKNAVPVFEEKAAEYGLNDDSYSTMASFFDYDNDGDLDVYITVNETVLYVTPTVYRRKITDGSFPSTGRLYRNDWNSTVKHPFFTNVTKQARVTIEGYGHAATIADFNKDGWKDIFVTNDFLSNDLLYINNHDGTFTDKVASYFKHTSANGMGQDVIDINNDGLSDVVELDMYPEDNYRKQTLMAGNNYHNYQNNELYGYQYQYVRNTLQLNLGQRVNGGDSLGDPIFGDVGFFSGIFATDWSWTPVVQDFDNDGLRDIVITNGYPKDLTDHDFIAFREKSFASASKSFVLSKIPQVKLKHYAFHNNGDVTFTNATDGWGLTKPSFSNGAVYADLDNDGDMDIVVNNINDDAFIYKNTLRDENKNKSNYLSVKLVGDSLNRNGFGAWIEVYYNGKQQVYEQTPYRGYLSTIPIEPHFGLGDVTKADSVIIKWPDQKKQAFLNIGANQTVVADYKEANHFYSWNRSSISQDALFKEVTNAVGVHYRHKEEDFIDFDIQKLLPHKFSEYNPALAAGDINGDGLDDIVIGDSQHGIATVLLQQSNGRFIQKNILSDSTKSKDMGIALFDADNDGDLDLYIAGGGYEFKPNSPAYRDKLYVNDGKGNFKLASGVLPENYTSKSCVRAADFDNDGDLDLFIAGRVDPWNYPHAVSSFIYRNDSKTRVIKFTDVTSSVAPSLIKAGMVCDGIWTDYNNDGWQDLIFTGEWMPIKILKNNHGKFTNVSSTSGINNKTGWWNSITSGDFDNDGDMDYVVGNLGENTYYKASDQYPVNIYATDFYKTGVSQCLITQYLKDSTAADVKEFTANMRDDIIDQLPIMKKRFLTYAAFAKTPFSKLFTQEEMKSFTKYSANYFKSSFIGNNGNGTFTMQPLPAIAQYSAINGMITEDFDGDGNLDICFNTNDYSTDPSNGRYDALNGLILKGDGKGKFTPLTISKSGIFIEGNGRALVKLRSSKGKVLVAASQNKGNLKIFQSKKDCKMIAYSPFDVSAVITCKNGSHQKREAGYGASFLSQSARFLNIDSNVISVEIKNNKGGIRNINIDKNYRK